MRREQVGSLVLFDGRECFVSNWAGSAFPTLCGDNGFYQTGCPRGQIVNVRTIREFLHRFNFGFGFYMGSWYGIDVQKQISP
jgi:hypothetical protein